MRDLDYQFSKRLDAIELEQQSHLEQLGELYESKNRTVGMHVRFCCKGEHIFVIDSPVSYPLAKLGDSVVLMGNEYRILWRRWRYEMPAESPKVYVDIEVERQLY